ncbi:hypothetical protein KBK19_01235 [Microvirga sp. STR05]|uniref:NTR domain-containing protein n=1 Tax=Hymenobacter duratus TaxID=2771356 RepID=A0ABR8JE63_9BACT|nr:hypothetical protein [Hymenobacter duratus]MBD2713650.1 hypothetical protein [Hymenobacter duratus]MBR7948552.1 hypothetical protein [Microvirga sp. STR05]
MRKLLFLSILYLLPYSLKACSCGRIGICKSRKSAQLVLTGILISTKTNLYKDSLNRKQARHIIHTFKVQHVYKGKVIADTVSLTTPAAHVDCGSYFMLNKSYLIYSELTDQDPTDIFGSGKKVIPYLTTNMCTRTKRNRFLTIYEKSVLTVL